MVAAVCALAAFSGFYVALDSGQSHMLFLASGVLFGCVAVYMVWRVVDMGNCGAFYDDEKIILVLSRKDRREFRWEKLKEANVFYPTSPSSWVFCFLDQKKAKKLAVTPRMTGYREFVEMLRKKGFPVQGPGVLNFDKDTAGEVFKQVFGEDFGKGGKDQKK